MNAKFRTRALIGVAAAAAFGLVIAPVTSAMAAPLDNGSEFPIYLVDADSETTVAGQTLQWESVVSAVANLASPYDRFPASADATGVKYFISAPGDEYTQAQWYGTQGGAINNADHTNGLSYMPLNTFEDGDRSGDVSEVQTNGGTYSLGFVYTSENGNQIASGKGAWFRIQVTPVTGAWTFTEPVAAQVNVAPAITTQPAGVTVTAGATATFTAAASGTPAPTVKWQSSTNGTDWSDVAGATSASYTTPATTVASSGTQYRAVFTNTAGTATSNAATLTVGTPAPTAPEEPTAGDAGNVVIPAPADGATVITVPAGAANANKTLTAWAWSDPTNLGQVTTDAAGNAQVDISGLPAGTHTIALAESDFTVVAWGTVEVAQPANTAAVDLQVDVITSNKFSLEGVAAGVDLGEVRRGQVTSAELPAFTVIDDRDELLGWNLTAAVEDFALDGGAVADAIPASNFGLKPQQVGTAPAGISLGAEQVAGTATYDAAFAEGATGSTTLEGGTQFDATLSFTAPTTAKAGTYKSTLTLTLETK